MRGIGETLRNTSVRPMETVRNLALAGVIAILPLQRMEPNPQITRYPSHQAVLPSKEERFGEKKERDLTPDGLGKKRLPTFSSQSPFLNGRFR